MPEELLLEVIGSRKPVVFVEGENGSFDVALYRALLRGFLVIPVGGCSRVIQSVKGLKENRQIHHLEIFGIIDRDRRVDAELTSLESAGVFALDVAEVENLFCTPEIIELIARKLEKSPDLILKQVEEFIFEKLNAELETQISLRCTSEIKFKLNLFDEKTKGESGLQDSLNTLTTAIDVHEIYIEAEKNFHSVINDKNYRGVLRLYNRKSLASQICGILGFKNSEFSEYVVRLAKGSATSEVANALRPYFGKFAENIV
jgi:hypothetical protein